MVTQETTLVFLSGDWRRWGEFLSECSDVCWPQYQPSGMFCVPQCHPSGCLTDLFIQMAVILVLKQTLNNIFEFTGPWVFAFNSGFCSPLHHRVGDDVNSVCCPAGSRAFWAKNQHRGWRGSAVTVTEKPAGTSKQELSRATSAKFGTGWVTIT